MESFAEDGWVEEEIRRQLQDISVEDLEVIADGHGLGYYGDNQIKSIDVSCNEDTVDLELDDDDSTSTFDCYLAKLAELENSSYSMLREAKLTLNSVPNRPDTINDRSNTGIQGCKRNSQQNGNQLDGSGAKQERCGLNQDVSIVSTSPKTCGTGEDVCNGCKSVEMSTSPPQGEVTSSSGDLLSENGRKSRRRSAVSVSRSRTAVKSSYSRRHSYDSGTGSRSSRLLYDRHEELFLKTSCPDSALYGEDNNNDHDDDDDDDVGVPSHEAEELMKEMQLRQEMWSIRLQELERQRMEHNKVLEEHEVQVATARFEAACVIQAAVRGWRMRKLHRPSILARARARRIQEERQLQRIVWLQAQCRGSLMRRTYCQKLQEWRARREARQAALARSLCLLQARARGKLLRGSLSGKMQTWKNAHAGVGIPTIVKIQAVCRGYLLRRITTSILKNLRDTRMKEREDAGAEKESTSEVRRKKLKANECLQGSSKMSAKQRANSSRERPNSRHGPNFRERPNSRNGSTSRERPSSRNKRRASKGRNLTWIVWLQARARGFLTRNTVQMRIAGNSVEERRSDSNSDKLFVASDHQLHTLPNLKELQQHQQDKQLDKQHKVKLQKLKEQRTDQELLHHLQQQEQLLQQSKKEFQHGQPELQNQVISEETEYKLKQQKSSRPHQSEAENQKYKQCKIQEKTNHEQQQQQQNKQHQQKLEVSQCQSLQGAENSLTKTSQSNHCVKSSKELVAQTQAGVQGPPTPDQPSAKDGTSSDKAEARGDIFTLPFLERTSGRETDRIGSGNERILPEVEELARQGRARSTYKTELEHATQPLSGRALLGLLEERLMAWQTAQRKNCVDSRTSSIQPRTSSTQLRTSSIQPGTEVQESWLPEEGSSPLTDSQLLSASPEGTLLQDIVRVSVTGCDFTPTLSSLKACPRVMSVTLAKCGLQKVKGLRDCPQLRQLHLPGNELKELSLGASVCEGLCFVSLNDNCLASIQGLDHCHNLLHLSVARNRLARVSNLHHNTHLTKLNLDQNILINCKGLEVLSELEFLSLCENHLVQVEGLNNSFCLQQLLLSHNNIQQPPILDCHVLLTELSLNDNNLADISSITSAWLPRLRHLCLSNNCVTQMDSLACLLMLSTLNLAYNSIYDLPVLLQSVHGCFNLKSLALVGNPVVEEPSFRRLLRTAVPSLCKLDDYELIKHSVKSGARSCGASEHSYVPDTVATSYIYKLCIQQESKELDMKDKHNNIMSALGRVGASGDINATRTALDARVKCCHDYHNILKQHLEDWKNLQPIPLQQRPKRQSMLGGHMDKKEQDEPASDEPLSVREHNSLSGTLGQIRKVQKDTMLVHAAIRVQAVWRGLLGRKLTEKMREKKNLEKRREEENRKTKAVIVIQATVRGFLLRRHLHHILSVSPDPEELSEDQLLELFDESEIEKELIDEDFGPLALDDNVMDYHCKQTCNIRTLSDRKDPILTQRIQPPTANKESAGGTATLLPGATTYTESYQQWSNDQSAITRNTPSSAGMVTEDTSQSMATRDTLLASHHLPHSLSHKPSPPTHGRHPYSSLTVREVWSRSHTPTPEPNVQDIKSVVVNKTEAKKTLKEELTKEWGLSSSTTAQLMLKRAKRQKKLEHTAMQRKIMADPRARLARFKRQGLCQHQSSPVKPSEASSSTSSPASKPSQVFRWTHSEKSITSHAPREGISSTQSVANKQHQSERLLPEMEPHILAGYSTRLISSDSLNRLVTGGATSTPWNSHLNH